MIISRILIAINATREASLSLLDAYHQIIQKGKPSVKVMFISYLSDLFKKSLGPNTLNHWMEEERESMDKVSSYFARMDIPYDHKIINVPPWEIIFYEISDEAEDQDLIILGSEILQKVRKDKADCALCSNVLSKVRCPILLIHSPQDQDQTDYATRGEGQP